MAQRPAAAQQVTEAPAHPRQRNELALTGGGRGLAQQDHEHRHQRRSQQQQHRCQRTEHSGADDQQHGDQQHQLTLHPVTADIAVQRLDLLQQTAAEFRVGAQLRPRRPQRRQTLQQGAAQLAAGAQAGQLAGLLTAVLQQRTQDQTERQPGQQTAQ